MRMLGPSRLVRGVRRRIEETLLSAETAVMTEAEAIADAIMAQAEPEPVGRGPGRPAAPGRRDPGDRRAGWCAT